MVTGPLPQLFAGWDDGARSREEFYDELVPRVQVIPFEVEVLTTKFVLCSVLSTRQVDNCFLRNNRDVLALPSPHYAAASGKHHVVVRLSRIVHLVKTLGRG